MTRLEGIPRTGLSVGFGGAIFASIASLGKYPAVLVGALVGIFNLFTIIGDPSVGGVLYVCTLCRVSIIDYFRKVYKWALIFGAIGIVLITIYFRMW
jgi:hypothetical protein